MTQVSPTVGILYPGDLGSLVARLLVEQGHVVVTTCEGRSDPTRQRAVESGARVLESVAEVVQTSDVLLSTVLPDAAAEVADNCRSAVSYSDAAEKWFVDMNSIHPDTVRQIGVGMQQAGYNMVDATIHGTTSHLQERGVLYLSGEQKQQVDDLFSPIVRVVDLGECTGMASTMKLLMSGLSKGLSALFVEVTRIAHDQKLLPTYLDEVTTFYPDIATVLERLVSTYPRHAARRVSELTALASMASSFSPGMVREAASQVRYLADLPWPDDFSTMSLRDVIEFAAESDQCDQPLDGQTKDAI